MQNGERLIKGGLLVSGSGVARKDVLVRGDTIAAVEDDLSSAAGDIVDATGLYVLPGIIDAHNHPVNADRIDTMSVSAAHGGITTMIPFTPDDSNAEGESVVDGVERFIEEARESSVLDFAVHAMLYPSDDPETDIPALVGMGVTSFKMFMSYASSGVMMPDDRLITCMKLAAEHGGVAMVHAENGQCLDHLIQESIAVGRTSAEHFGPAHPRIAEVEAVNRAATYAAVTGATLYVVHISAGETLGALRRAREAGVPVYGETCPQYLALDNSYTLDQGPLARIGPPLREPEDIEALWRGIDSGELDVIASDSCGYTRAMKPETGNIFEDSYGGNWIEQMVPVVYHEGVNTGRTGLPRIVRALCENPARIFGLYPKKGTVAPGSDADIVLFDPAIPHVLSAEGQHSVADFTLFDGKQVLGRPVWSMQRGEVLLEDGEVKRQPGRAAFLPGTPG